jgi:hypothetical protein
LLANYEKPEDIIGEYGAEAADPGSARTRHAAEMNDYLGY